tara:strand:- start:204 stop:383 length:180 start_codon:yes stop_codon:yes gene_type:complete
VKEEANFCLVLNEPETATLMDVLRKAAYDCKSIGMDEELNSIRDKLSLIWADKKSTDSA